MRLEEKLNLSKYRLDKAKEELVSAKVLFNAQLYSKSLNSSYYAMFHAVRSILALDEVDSKKHSSVISHFIKSYVHTNKIDKEIGKNIVKAERSRNDSDYRDFYIASKEAAEKQIQNATDFIDHLERLINTRIAEIKQ